MTLKLNQLILCRQVDYQFEGKLWIPFIATHVEKWHGRETRWNLSANETPEHIKANWPGCAWIVVLITTTTTTTRSRKGICGVACHRFITTLRTTPEALLRLIRQRWSIENEWHWSRDVQLGEDAHRYANCTGAAVFSFLRTLVI